VPLQSLDHVNVRTNNLAAMIAWYRDVLGMEDGSATRLLASAGPGCTADGKPIVHLVEVKEEPAAIAPKIEHFAIGGSDLEGFLSASRGCRMWPTKSAARPIFRSSRSTCHDPDKNHIHIDFHSDEAGALDRRGL
jgi:catechol 2,3-dioxygenase-like lactoylglutathione lyase family enzyme